MIDLKPLYRQAAAKVNRVQMPANLARIPSPSLKIRTTCCTKAAAFASCRAMVEHNPQPHEHPQILLHPRRAIHLADVAIAV